MGEIQDLANHFRVQLLNREAQSVLRLTRSYRPVVRRLDVEIGRLEGKMRDTLAAGGQVDPVWVFQRDRFNVLRSAAVDEVHRWAQSAQVEVEGAQDWAVRRVNRDSDQLATAALPPPLAGSERGVSVQFSKLGEDALQEFVGRASDGGPLRDLFNELAGDLADNLQDSLTAGLAIGKNPILVARELRSLYQMPLKRGVLITRTEMLNAYRGATKERYRQNSDILHGWTWVSVLARTTCPACWVMHGSRHSVEETLDGHPNCRCVMIPLTKSWEELGFEGIPDTRPVVPDGESLLRLKPEDFQRGVLGPKAYEKWQAGEIRLTDLLGRKDNPRWGTMRYTRSLRQIERSTGGFQIGETARGGLIIPTPTPTPSSTHLLP